MDTVLNYIAARASAYSADPRLTTLIAHADVRIGTVYGTSRNQAISLLVLHWLTMDDRVGSGAGVGGTIKRDKEGSLEREYMIDFKLTEMEPDLTQTRWGMELIQLKRENVITPLNRFCAV